MVAEKPLLSSLQLLLKTDNYYEKEITPEIQNFLDRYYKAIKAGRAFAQVIDGQYQIDEEQMKELTDIIENESDKKLNKYELALCEIDANGQVFQHHGAYFGNELNNGERAIKGFWFDFDLGTIFSECVVLDFGRSRNYWDQMSRSEKRKFLRRFAYRSFEELDLDQHNPDYFINRRAKPLGYTVFISDTGVQFEIEMIATVRPVKTVYR